MSKSLPFFLHFAQRTISSCSLGGCLVNIQVFLEKHKTTTTNHFIDFLHGVLVQNMKLAVYACWCGSTLICI